MIHHNSEESEVLEEEQLDPKNLPSPSSDILVHTHTHSLSRFSVAMSGTVTFKKRSSHLKNAIHNV